jgi:hypothetical protein
MAKEPASETIMPLAKIKPLLILSKKEPVQAAIGLTSDGEGVILLDKKASPRKVGSMLKASAAKAKLQLNTSSLRFGRAEVDPEYDSTMVRFFLNKDAPGAMRPKLVEVLKRAAFGKVELNVDPSIDEEAEEGAEGQEAAGAATPPPAPPPPPGPSQGDTVKELAGLIRRIPEAAGADAGLKAKLAKLATDANAQIKANDLEAAGGLITQLREAIDAGGAAAKPAGRKSLPTWIDAKEEAGAQIGKLQEAMRGLGHPLFARLADQGLNGITGRLQVGLQVALTELDGASGEARVKAQQKARGAVADLRSFLSTDPVLPLLEDNPLGVPVTLRAGLSHALDTIDAVIAG